jgi:hypothetical protein
MTVDSPGFAGIGVDVYRSTGERIGSAESVYSNPADRPAWVTVTTGLFGTHCSFIPLSDAAVTPDRITVRFSKDHIRDSPTVEPTGSRLNPDEERSLKAHYGLADHDT